MGFKCPICSKDFGNSDRDMRNHAKDCCDGAALDVIKIIDDIKTSTDKLKQEQAKTKEVE